MTVLIATSSPPAAAPDPSDALAVALTRFLATRGCPDYLRDAAAPWLASSSRT